MGALQFLCGLGGNDLLMFCRHTVDSEGRLEHLFWNDGASQMNYKIFGDVLAFDATYCKNKYHCPFVVFSGVNHHNHTTVFASAIVANKTEDTYIWLLEPFMEAMNNKSPSSVITDGDMAMRNAIKKVIPNARHRLCAWHLLRNGTSNVRIPGFTAEFKNCMLRDWEVDEFEKNGLKWFLNLVWKKIGLRTTSRCEGLNAQIGRFMQSRNNLTDFVQHFQRYLNYQRYKEGKADFLSTYGQLVLQSNFHALEISAAKQFTREIFLLFRPTLERCCLMNVIGCKEVATYSIYIVSKYQTSSRQWHVSFYEPTAEFSCSCQRMDSYGLPYDHIIVVLVYLGFDELPKSLVLNRWSKSAKKSLRGTYSDGSYYWDSQMLAQYESLLGFCRDMCTLACEKSEHYYHARETVMGEIAYLKAEKGIEHNNEDVIRTKSSGTIKDPMSSRRKQDNHSASNGATRSRKLIKCGFRSVVGHNRRPCLTCII